MANIVYISKYPPLEGGIASKTYWLANALARSGHTIHVVTDPVAVDTHLTIPDADQPPVEPGVYIHRAEQVIPWHIPNDNHRSISLLDNALKVVSEEKPDLIISGYLVPYGIIAWHVSHLTGIPFILMHGGSDVRKFLLNEVWPYILPQALAEACLIITDYDNQDYIRRFTNSISVLPPYVPDATVFSKLHQSGRDTIVLALIGKANFHWQHKGWQRITDLWSKLGAEFRFVVLSQGVGLEAFKTSVPTELIKRINWLHFVPPWNMPEFLRSIDGLFYFQDQLPFPMYSNTVLEALACGTVVLTDSIDIMEGYRRYGLDCDNFWKESLLCTILEPKQVNSVLVKHFAKKKSNAVWDCDSVFNQYVSDIERVFLETIGDHP